MDWNTCFCSGQDVRRVIELLIVVVFQRKWFFLTQNKVNLVLLTLCTCVIAYCTCSTNNVSEYVSYYFSCQCCKCGDI